MDPSSRVFYNPYLMDLILSNIPGGMMRNLSIRLISQIFNSACIENIGRNHQTLKIEYTGKTESILTRLGFLKPRDQLSVKICINYQQYGIQKLESYLKFLEINTIDVKKIVLRNVWKMSDQCKTYMHDIINMFRKRSTYTQIESVYGIESLCNQCADCRLLAINCRKEYYITRSGICSEIHQKTHFDKLIINDCFLDIFCFKIPYQGQDSYITALEQNFNSNISCDTLILHIGEKKYESRQNSDLTNHPPLPRELLERIMKKWNVKRFGLKFDQSEELGNVCFAVWQNWGFINEFKFNDEFISTSGKDYLLQLDHVNIDLSDSLCCAEGITQSDTNWKSYQNIIANIRRLFSVNHISIDFSHWSHPKNQEINSAIKNIMKTVSKEDSRGLRVDIRYFGLDVNFDDISLPGYSNFKLSTFSEDIECYKYHVKNDHQFEKRKWIGKRIKMEDSKANCEISMDILTIGK